MHGDCSRNQHDSGFPNVTSHAWRVWKPLLSSPQECFPWPGWRIFCFLGRLFDAGLGLLSLLCSDRIHLDLLIDGCDNGKWVDHSKPHRQDIETPIFPAITTHTLENVSLNSLTGQLHEPMWSQMANCLAVNSR